MSEMSTVVYFTSFATNKIEEFFLPNKKIVFQEVGHCKFKTATCHAKATCRDIIYYVMANDMVTMNDALSLV